MIIETIIHSNGSKWAGEEPDTIEKLIEVLKTETIEERFFSTWTDRHTKGNPKYNFCPIKTEKQGKFYKKGYNIFFGNFERISHVFRIETNDPKTVKDLTTAIKNNKGWLKYYEKNLIK